jgi:hypothetical protein
MKILKDPQAEIEFISLNPNIEKKSFVYTIGDNFPTEEMRKHMLFLQDNLLKTGYEWFRHCVILPVEIELNQQEYFQYKEKIDRFLAIAPGFTLFPKEDLVVENYNLVGAFFKSGKEANGVYHCEFVVDLIQIIE